MVVSSDEQLMREAISLASEAQRLGEVPIGCVVYHLPTSRIIGRGCNRRETDHDPSAHAEIVAMRQAGLATGRWRLTDCILAVTLEPCPMCAGAIVNSRIARLLFGCHDPKAGAVESLYQICTDNRLNHRVEVAGGILSAECGKLLSDFFRHQRSLGKK